MSVVRNCPARTSLIAAAAVCFLVSGLARGQGRIDGPPILHESAKLLASDGAAGDSFGLSVAVSGETVVVGAYQDDDLVSDSGSGYVFERHEAGTWTEVAKLLASDGAARDWFGTSVAVSGETVVVGAHGDGDLEFSSGSAYVFSLEDCVLELRLDSTAVRAGENLSVELDLQHNRPQTVTVPFVLWIENEAGAILVERTTPPLTFHHGDTMRQTLTMRIPGGTPPGRYAVMVGIERMQQGVAWARQVFRVVD